MSVLEKDKAQLEGKLTAVKESAETLKDEVARIRDKLSTKTSTLRLERDDLTSKLATYGADLARMQSERDNNAAQLAESQSMLKLRDETIKSQQELLYGAASNEGTIKALTDQLNTAFDAREKAEGVADERRMANDTLQKKNQDLRNRSRPSRKRRHPSRVSMIRLSRTATYKSRPSKRQPNSKKIPSTTFVLACDESYVMATNP